MGRYLTYIRLHDVSIIFVLLSFYFSFIIESVFGFGKSKYLFLMISFFFFGLRILIKPHVKIFQIVFDYMIIGVGLMLLSVWFWSTLSEINVYLTLITFVIVITRYSFFLKYVKFVFYIMLVLALYEYVVKDYIFVLYRQTQWGIKPLDPVFFGGTSGVFRSKALFSGPLALGQFVVGFSLVFRKNVRYILLSILISMLASSRLGILIGSLVLCINLYDNSKVWEKVKVKHIVYMLLISIMMITVAIYASSNAFARLYSIFSLNDSGNSARIHYWVWAIETFSEYDILHKLVGDSGYFRIIAGNSAENGWLMLLLNNGFLGLVYYLMPMLYLFKRSRDFKTNHYLYVVVLFIAMNIQTFHLGLSANLFYWLILYSIYEELRCQKYID